MTLTVDFKNEQDFLEVRTAMKAVVRKGIFNTLIAEGFDANTEVSVTFTDNEKIKELNAKFRNIDKSTDVLSFPMLDDLSEADDYASCDEPVPLGDIVLSLERAYEQGHELGHSVYREVLFLTVHSTLHLLGYDHVTSKEDEEEMFAKQQKIMESMGAL